MCTCRKAVNNHSKIEVNCDTGLLAGFCILENCLKSVSQPGQNKYTYPKPTPSIIPHVVFGPFLFSVNISTSLD